MSWFLDDARASRDGHRAQPVPRDDRPRTTLGRLRSESRDVSARGRKVTAIGRMGTVSYWVASDDRAAVDTVLVGTVDGGPHA